MRGAHIIETFTLSITGASDILHTSCGDDGAPAAAVVDLSSAPLHSLHFLCERDAAALNIYFTVSQNSICEAADVSTCFLTSLPVRTQFREPVLGLLFLLHTCHLGLVGV